MKNFNKYGTLAAIKVYTNIYEYALVKLNGYKI